MYGLLTSLFNQHFGSPTYNICLLGPEETGKTVSTTPRRPSSPQLSTSTKSNRTLSSISRLTNQRLG